jgi:hypothetical protein
MIHSFFMVLLCFTQISLFNLPWNNEKTKNSPPKNEHNQSPPSIELNRSQNPRPFLSLKDILSDKVSEQTRITELLPLAMHANQCFDSWAYPRHTSEAHDE